MACAIPTVEQVLIWKGVSMSHPDLIPIAFWPDSRTAYVGRHDGGQVFADIVGDPDWFNPKFQHTFTVVIHFFDHEGHHADSRFLAGIEDGRRAETYLIQCLESLSGWNYGAIEIRLFKFAAHGRLWGMVDRGQDSDWVDLEPEDLGFHAPWDGSYST